MDMMKKHRGAAWIEEDEQDGSCSYSPSIQQYPKQILLQQPTVVRPIATRPSDAFYAETEKANIPFQYVHLAVQETHEWENLWVTRMSEVNPMEGNDEFNVDTLLSALDIERNVGARNPSPECSEIRMTKRTFSNQNASLEPRQETFPMQIERRQQKVPLHRPIAMRVGAVITPPVPPQAADAWVIPREINHWGARSLSPITASGLVSRRSDDDSASNRSSLSRPLQSHSVREQNETHLIPDDGDQYCVVFPPRMMIAPKPQTPKLQQAREGLLYQLAVSQGETDSTAFLNCLSELEQLYKSSLASNPTHNCYEAHEGTWLTLTKPTFFGCLGDNDAGDPMYSLGRMTFDMFSPSSLICSLQGNFNTVHPVVEVPEGLIAQVGSDPSVLRTYK
jgi:hypothetical protein